MLPDYKEMIKKIEEFQKNEPTDETQKAIAVKEMATELVSFAWEWTESYRPYAEFELPRNAEQELLVLTSAWGCLLMLDRNKDTTKLIGEISKSIVLASYIKGRLDAQAQTRTLN